MVTQTGKTIAQNELMPCMRSLVVSAFSCACAACAACICAWWLLLLLALLLLLPPGDAAPPLGVVSLS